jgi:prepilin-type N-terminal cleavage/methylation domain-containing protein
VSYPFLVAVLLVRRARLKQKGFTFIELLVSVSVLIVVSLGFHTVLNDVLSSGRKNSVTTDALATVRKEINQMFWNEKIWQGIVVGNTPALDCLRASTVSCPNIVNPIPIEIFDFAGVRSYYQDGFTNKGEPCTTPYDPVNGNDQCPFRYTFTLEMFCTGAAPCSDPLAKIRGQLEYKVPNPKSINLNRYSVVLIRRTNYSLGAGVFSCFTVTYQAGTYLTTIDPGNTSPPADASQVTFYQKGTNPRITDNSGSPVPFWGFSCNQGWRAMGCSLKLVGARDMDKFISDNGCYSDDEEFNNRQASPDQSVRTIISGICCRII